LHNQTKGNLEKTMRELLGDHGADVLLKEHGQKKFNRLSIKYAPEKTEGEP
jgi:hypothetical protein